MPVELGSLVKPEGLAGGDGLLVDGVLGMFWSHSKQATEEKCTKTVKEALLKLKS